jgi:cytochrome bd-type quinol oxidase subunit 2
MADANASHARARTWARYFFVAFAVCFLAFAANVLAGKSQIAFDWRAPFLLSDVAEYLLLLVSAFFFTLATLFLERAKRDANDDA